MTTQPRIVHMVTSPISFWLLRDQAAVIRQAGFDMHAISSPGSLTDEYSAREDVPVTRVPMERRIAPLADLIALGRVLMALRRLKPEIVHAGTPKAGLLGMLAAWALRVPVRVYQMHGLPLLTARGARRLILRTTERLACATATHVLCVGPSIRDELVRGGLCNPRKAVVLGYGSCNGVDTNWFSRARLSPEIRVETRRRLGIPEDALVVGFIGRLVREKGIPELTAAWRRLREEFPSAYLLIVGPEEAADAVAPATLDELRRDPRVRLPGEDWDTAPLYAAMDLFCLPSHREGCPGVALEAAAMQLPVVAFAVPGVVDVIEHGTTGRLADPLNVESLTAAIREYLGNPALRTVEGDAARRRITARYEQANVRNVLKEFYLSATFRGMHTASSETVSRIRECTGSL